METMTKNVWRETTLGEICEIVGGGTPNTSHPEYWGGSIPWLSVADFNNGRRWVEGAVKTITTLGVDNSAVAVLAKGDLVISARGTVGAIAQLKIPMAFNQSCYGIRAMDKTMNDFLYYLIRANISQLKKNVHGAVFDTITRETFDQIHVSLPPLAEQRSIAAVLSSLDDKIELLRRQNETLEQIAQTIFNEWFMKPTADGVLPEGWKLATVADVADVSIGRTPPRKEKEWFSLNPNDKKWISIKDLGAVGTYIDSSSEYLTPEAVRQFKIPLIPRGTVVVSFKLTVGRVAIAAEDMYSNEAIAHIKTRTLPTEYTYLYFKCFDFDRLGSTSSIATATNSEAIRQMEMLVPDAYTLRRFADAASPIFEKMLLNTQSVRSLASVRDTLMPRLMSGEVRVS